MFVAATTWATLHSLAPEDERPYGRFRVNSSLPSKSRMDRFPHALANSSRLLPQRLTSVDIISGDSRVFPETPWQSGAVSQKGMPRFATEGINRVCSRRKLPE